MEDEKGSNLGEGHGCVVNYAAKQLEEQRVVYKTTQRKRRTKEKIATAGMGRNWIVGVAGGQNT